MNRWRLLFGAVAAVTTSCTLIVDTSDLGGGPGAVDAGSDAPDGSTSGSLDGTAPVDGLDADADAQADAADAGGPRRNSCGALLFGTPVAIGNPSFENGCSNSWSTYAATAIENTDAPSAGSIACRVCSSGSGPDGFIMIGSLGRPVVAGESYELVACIRGVPGGASGVSAYAELAATGGGKAGAGIAATDTYAAIRVGWDIDKDYPSVNLDLRSTSPAGSCFLVDDVSVSLIKEAGAP